MKKESILERLSISKKRKKNIIIIIPIAMVVLIFLAYFISIYFQTPEKELELGAEIEEVYLSDDLQTIYIRLAGGTNEQEITKIKFVFTDSLEEEYVYETEEGITEISVPFRRTFWDWFFGREVFEGKYHYGINSNKIGIGNFETIDKVGVIFEYQTDEGAIIETVSLDTKKPTPVGGGGGGGGGGDGDSGCTPSKTCADYPGKCGRAMSNGCSDSLDCRNNCNTGYYCYTGEGVSDACISNSITCIDSDGRNYLIKGDVKLCDNLGCGDLSPDSCFDVDSVTEYYCSYDGSNFEIADETVGCDNGCEDGACLLKICSEDSDCAEYDLSEISTCLNIPDDNPFTFDSAPAVSSICGLNNRCTLPIQTLTHTCSITDCSAECEGDAGCSCPSDICIDADGDGLLNDYVDYPDYGSCVDCECDIGVGEGEACEPALSPDNYYLCLLCGDGAINIGEECDCGGDECSLAELNSNDCTTIPGGFTGGTLSCYPQGHAQECEFNTEGCNMIITQCNDGIDNDGDMAVDYPDDFSCLNLIDNDETNPKAQCQDGEDNDLDGETDYPADSDCTSLQDNSEETITEICEATAGDCYYVDNTASGADDGSSWDNAWNSLQDIYDNRAIIQPGDYIYISGGDTEEYYYETLKLSSLYGTENSRITIKAGQDEGHNGKVIIDGQDIRSYGIEITGSNSFLTIDGEYNGIQNIQAQNHASTGISVNGGSSLEGIEIKHLEVDNNRQGIVIYPLGNFGHSIHHCKIHNNGVSAGGRQIVIPGHNNNDVGFDLLRVYNNEIYGTSADAISVAANGVSIYNNIFHTVLLGPDPSFHMDWIQSLGMKNIKIYNNKFYNFDSLTNDYSNGNAVIFVGQARASALVLHNGQKYICTQGHISSPSTEPGVGSNWQGFWETTDIPTAYPWINNKQYTTYDSSIYQSHDIYVFNNVIYGTTPNEEKSPDAVMHGLYFSSAAAAESQRNIIFANNNIVDITSWSVRFNLINSNELHSEDIDDVKILNNIFYNTQAKYSSGDSEGNPVKRHCIYIDDNDPSRWTTGSYGSGADVVFDHNQMALNSNTLGSIAFRYFGKVNQPYSTFKSDNGFEANGQDGEPSFVRYTEFGDDNDFHLAPDDNVAIDKGADLSEYCVKVPELCFDIEGNSRGHDGDGDGTGEWDIGAYEYQGEGIGTLGVWENIKDFFRNVFGITGYSVLYYDSSGKRVEATSMNLIGFRENVKETLDYSLEKLLGKEIDIKFVSIGYNIKNGNEGKIIMEYE